LIVKLNSKLFNLGLISTKVEIN